MMMLRIMIRENDRVTGPVLNWSAVTLTFRGAMVLFIIP